MFRHEGPARDAKHNTRVAACLAIIAGYVDVSGLLLLGTFTSHVTGNVGRLSAELARGDLLSAVFLFVLVAGFLWGAFVATLIIEGSTAQTPTAYGIAIVVQAAVLGSFVGVAWLYPTGDPLLLNLQASLLCMAMGMQNSLVTRLSGAVVRTTHLTGIVTDFGIEAARWYRWHRARSMPRASWGRVVPTRPPPGRFVLLSTIVLAFSVGAILGGLCTLRVGSWAVAVPAVATLFVGAYAFSQRQRDGSSPEA